jgi:hypothetical protein
MDMSNDLNKMAREKAVDKIRKLLAMANDGRGNEQEAETAARQAEKMMRAYQIDAAECIMKELETADAFDRGVEAAYFGPTDPRHVPAKASGWVGVIAFGVAQAFTCKVDTVMTPHGVKVRFSGFAMDVQLARWVYSYLCQTVYRLSVQNYKGMGATPAKAFRSGAAGTLQRRLFEIRDSRNTENRAGNGTALVLYDRKAQRVEEMFGAQKTKQSKATVRDQAAYAHGREEGGKINISTNRPIGQAAPQGHLN